MAAAAIGSILGAVMKPAIEGISGAVQRKRAKKGKGVGYSLEGGSVSMLPDRTLLHKAKDGRSLRHAHDSSQAIAWYLANHPEGSRILTQHVGNGAKKDKVKAILKDMAGDISKNAIVAMLKKAISHISGQDGEAVNVFDDFIDDDQEGDGFEEMLGDGLTDYAGDGLTDYAGDGLGKKGHAWKEFLSDQKNKLKERKNNLAVIEEDGEMKIQPYPTGSGSRDLVEVGPRQSSSWQMYVKKHMSNARATAMEAHPNASPREITTLAMKLMGNDYRINKITGSAGHYPTGKAGYYPTGKAGYYPGGYGADLDAAAADALVGSAGYYPG